MELLSPSVREVVSWLREVTFVCLCVGLCLVTLLCPWPLDKWSAVCHAVYSRGMCVGDGHWLVCGSELRWWMGCKYPTNRYSGWPGTTQLNLHIGIRNNLVLYTQVVCMANWVAFSLQLCSPPVLLKLKNKCIWLHRSFLWFFVFTHPVFLFPS